MKKTRLGNDDNNKSGNTVSFVAIWVPHTLCCTRPCCWHVLHHHRQSSCQALSPPTDHQSRQYGALASCHTGQLFGKSRISLVSILFIVNHTLKGPLNKETDNLICEDGPILHFPALIMIMYKSRKDHQRKSSILSWKTHLQQRPDRGS